MAPWYNPCQTVLEKKENCPEYRIKRLHSSINEVMLKVSISKHGTRNAGGWSADNGMNGTTCRQYNRAAADKPL